MRRIWMMLGALVLLAAACGNDSGGLGAFGDDAPSSDSSGSGGDTGGDSGGSDGSGAGGDFCGLVESINEQFDIGFSTDPDALRDVYGEIRDVAQQARSIAPPEIADDVATLADGTNQFYEALEAVDFDVTQVPEDVGAGIADEMDAAGERVDAFCGLDDGSSDDFSSDDSSSSDDDGSSDDFSFEDDIDVDDGSFGGDIPDDFPEDLIPPDYDDVFTFNAGGASTVTFTITAAYDDVFGYYSSVLGEPAFSSSSSDGNFANWSQGTSQTVTLGESDGTVSVTVATLG